MLDACLYCNAQLHKLRWCSTGACRCFRSHPQQLKLAIKLACLPPTFRGVALEALGRFDEAVSDYRAVLAAAPEDPSAWNNLGNAYAGGWPKGRVGG